MKYAVLVAVLFVSACGNVEYVSTSSGPVGCAGYLDEYVYLDHAVKVPEGMSKAEADVEYKKHGARKLLAQQ